MSSLLVDTIARLVVNGLWVEIVRFAELWLRLVSWLIEENERALASLPALAPWLVLLLILAAQALSRSIAQPRPRIQPPVGGAR